jgi:hypothetical protein
MTATTTTITCTPSSSSTSHRRQTDGTDEAPACPIAEWYVLWPRDGNNAHETDNIAKELNEILRNKNHIRVSEVKAFGVNFWRAYLNPGQVEDVLKITNIVSVRTECIDCGDPLTSWRYQHKYATQMEVDGFTELGRNQMLYLSKNQKSAGKLDNLYFFDISAGQDIPVYIVDTGAQLDHIEFSDGVNIAAKSEFIFVGEDYDGQQHRDDSGAPLGGACRGPCKAHGTAMLGMIAGKNLGVSKRVKPYIVRVPRMSPSGGSTSPHVWLEGVAKVLDSILEQERISPQHNHQTRAILSLSWYYNKELFEKGSGLERKPNPLSFEEWISRLHSLLTTLISKGVFVVTGSGNSLGVNGWPALFGAPPDKVEESKRDGWLHIPELMVVGAAHAETGQRWWKSGIDVAKGIPHIYAPGYMTLEVNGNKSSWNDETKGYRPGSGTSIGKVLLEQACPTC